MGKQSKRKNKRRGGKQHRPTGLADDPTASAPSGTAEGNSPASKIIQKIRHGDPRVRHASLVALSRTLYDCNALENAAAASSSKNSGGEKINKISAEANNPSLLRALSEKILDTDIPCATTAVGCLLNYVSFYCGNEGAMDLSGVDGEDDVASDVMVPILLQRLQSSLGTIRSLGNTMMQDRSSKKESKKGSSSDNAADKQWLTIKEQWVLLSLSLSTLAALIENCPKAHERCGTNAFPQLLSVFDLATSSIKIWTADSFLPRKEMEPIFDAVTNASRGFHSLLDDNSSLITSLPVVGVAAAASTNAPPSLTVAVSELTNVITNSTMPTMTKLHASGSILSLRKVLVLESELVDATAEEEALAVALQSCTNDVIVPLFSMLFASFHTNCNGDDSLQGNSISSNQSSPKHLLNRMIDLSQKLSTIQHDKSMEDQIVNEVNARKEPARDIARRQKKLKEEKKADAKKGKHDAGDDGIDMQVINEGEEKSKPEMSNVAAAGAAMVAEEHESPEDNAEEKRKEQKQAEEELKVELDGIVTSWKDIVCSHKLALELVANLCSGSGEDEEDDYEGYEDEDEHMWDSDDEANLISAANDDARNKSSALGGSSGNTPCEQATYDSMTTQHHLPEKILGFFRSWIDFITQSPASVTPNVSMTDGETTKSDVPDLVSQDVDEILSTCALCLGNAVARDLPTWDNNGLESFWHQLCSTLPDNNVGWNQSQHITSVMLSMLQNQPASRTLVNEATLSGFVSMLNFDNGDASIVQTHSNIISIMGVLCSETHPTPVNSNVCCALVQRLLKSSTHVDINNNDNEAMKHSVIITQEIFNVLMDMYSNDDAHDEVFEKEGVLDHFRRILPGFKRRIKKVAGAAAEEKGVWNETALNMSRFIKYKSGGK